MPPSATSDAAPPRSLLPWPSTSTTPDDEASTAGAEPVDKSTKRAQVVAACNECRTKKVKCSADRPSCERCTKRQIPCQWDVAPEETRTLAMKRKHEETVEEVQRLTATTSQYDELIDLIFSARSTEEASDVLRYMRMSRSRDPGAILSYIKDGDLHMQRRLVNPATDPLAAQIDAEALKDSHIKVSARPWTSVASDGVVSHLISLYFDRFQPFHLCWPDEGSFLEDMRAGDVKNAKYCSPMLVNIMCAFAAFHSPHAAAADAVLGGKLRKRFYDHARICADKDGNRPSVVTAEAMMLLFLYTGAAAIDRVGTMYRYAACSMYHRIGLGRISAKTLYEKDPTGVYARAMSRAAWGLFTMESVLSMTFLESSMIPIPKTPRAFMDYRDQSYPIQHKPGPCDFSLDRQSSIIELVHHLWNSPSMPTVKPGSAEDLKNKLSLYKSIGGCLTTFPQLLFAPDRTRDYLFLKIWYHVIAITIYRPIVEQDIELPHLGGTPQTLCLAHCNEILRNMAAWRKYSEVDMTRGLPSTVFPLYIALFTLMPMLNRDPASHRPLIQCCRIFTEIAPTWPQAPALLKAAQATLKEMRVDPPKEAKEMMERAEWEQEPGLPMGLRIPSYSDLYAMRVDDGNGPWFGGIELGELISKCSALTIEE